MMYETYIDRGGRRLTSVGLAQARPNYTIHQLPDTADTPFTTKVHKQSQGISCIAIERLLDTSQKTTCIQPDAICRTSSPPVCIAHAWK